MPLQTNRKLKTFKTELSSVILYRLGPYSKRGNYPPFPHPLSLDPLWSPINHTVTLLELHTKVNYALNAHATLTFPRNEIMKTFIVKELANCILLTSLPMAILSWLQGVQQC